MTNPFLQVDLEWCLAELESHSFLWQLSNRLFKVGDHWQEGFAWAGPRPPKGEAMYDDIMAEIERSQITQNVLKEGGTRHSDGVVGNEPSWNYTVTRPIEDDTALTADESATIAEAEAALTTWWDQRGIHELLQTLLLTACFEGRAPIRLLIPPGLLTEDHKLPKVSTLAQALDLIYIELPNTDDMTVVTDLPTRQQAGIFQYTGTNEVTKEDEARVELACIDGEDTLIRVLRPRRPEDPENSVPVEEELRLRLGKRPLHNELVVPLLVTAQAVSLQKLLNMALTMLGRNVVQGGFLEKIITNAQVPGEYVPDATAPTGQRFVPASLKTGTGATQFLSGYPIKSPEGLIINRTTPGVIYKDPVQVTTFVGTKAEAYLSLMEEMHQSHVVINSDATASGKSRREARREFIEDLKKSKAAVDRLGRWMIETAIALASLILLEPKKYQPYRAIFDCHLAEGPISPEDETAIISVYEAGLRSQYNSMVMLGTDDVDAELLLIQEEREQAVAIPGFPIVESGTGEEDA